MVRIASTLLFTSACAAATAVVHAVDSASTIASAEDSPPRRPEDIDCALSKSGSNDGDDTDFSYSDDFDPDWGSVVGPFGQCGGDDYEGPTECVQDWTCYELREGFSQCIPDASVALIPSSSGSIGDEPCSDEPAPTSPCPDEPASDSPAPASIGDPDPSLSPAPPSSEPPTETPMPTTDEPATSEPPVTETPVPSAVDPSTAPTTEEPPTETPSPTTEAPTTDEPTTEPPVTEVPPTEEPTTAPTPVSPEPTTPTADTPVVSPADPTPAPTPVTPADPTEEPSTPSLAPATSAVPHRQTELVGAWKQCGGVDFDYSVYGVNTGDQSGTTTLMCVSGFQCDAINEYFAQCVPRHEPGRGAYWAQCGGDGFSGSTTCTSGSTCTYYNEWYSQCVPQDK